MGPTYSDAALKWFLEDTEFIRNDWWLAESKNGGKLSINHAHPELKKQATSSNNATDGIQIEPAPVLWEWLRRHPGVHELRTILWKHFGEPPFGKNLGVSTFNWPISQVLSAFGAMRLSGLLCLFGHLPWHHTDGGEEANFLNQHWKQLFKDACQPMLYPDIHLHQRRSTPPIGTYLNLYEEAEKEGVRDPTYVYPGEAGLQLQQMLGTDAALANHLIRLLARSIAAGHKIHIISHNPGLSRQEIINEFGRHLPSRAQNPQALRIQRDDLLTISEFEQDRSGDPRKYPRRMSTLYSALSLSHTSQDSLKRRLLSLFSP